MVSHRFALFLGVFLLIEGIWGLFSPVVFGVLTTNLLHATIHILLGAAGFWAGRTGRARPYLLAVGALLVVVGLLRFVPVVSDLVISLLNVNVPVAIFNVVVGAICLAIVAWEARVAQPA
ncbi:MAG: DUF4383 domain-containing protein [Deltaproteobacteria bacterium]|nr:DUF4383 domain-containing protein [Deltaproteobacteria bacterium]